VTCAIENGTAPGYEPGEPENIQHAKPERRVS
jgi:hypothetical protein